MLLRLSERIYVLNHFGASLLDVIGQFIDTPTIPHTSLLDEIRSYRKPASPFATSSKQRIEFRIATQAQLFRIAVTIDYWQLPVMGAF